MSFSKSICFSLLAWLLSVSITSARYASAEGWTDDDEALLIIKPSLRAAKGNAVAQAYRKAKDTEEDQPYVVTYRGAKGDDLPQTYRAAAKEIILVPEQAYRNSKGLLRKAYRQAVDDGDEPAYRAAKKVILVPELAYRYANNPPLKAAYRKAKANIKVVPDHVYRAIKYADAQQAQYVYRGGEDDEPPSVGYRADVNAPASSFGYREIDEEDAVPPGFGYRAAKYAEEEEEDVDVKGIKYRALAGERETRSIDSTSLRKGSFKAEGEAQ